MSKTREEINERLKEIESGKKLLAHEFSVIRLFNAFLRDFNLTDSEKENEREMFFNSTIGLKFAIGDKEYTTDFSMCPPLYDGLNDLFANMVNDYDYFWCVTANYLADEIVNKNNYFSDEFIAELEKLEIERYEEEKTELEKELANLDKETETKKDNNNDKLINRLFDLCFDPQEETEKECLTRVEKLVNACNNDTKKLIDFLVYSIDEAYNN